MSVLVRTEYLQVSTCSSGGTGVVTVAGELDIATAPELRAHVAEALSGDVDRVVLEMAGVGFIDATGLGTLVALAAQAERLGAELLVGGVSPVMARILAITGLDRRFPVQPGDRRPVPGAPALP
jgi:anti-sigma B factor antagonist